MTAVPVRRVRDLRVELHRVEAALGILHRRRSGSASVCAVTRKPSRRTGDRVAVAHPRPAPRPAGPASSTPDARLAQRRAARTRAGRSRPPRPRAPAPSAGARSRCRAPARRASNSPGSTCGAPSLVDRRRPARQDDAGGTHLAELGDRDVVRDDLGVDVTLADPPRDQLRVLRPEVDHQDGPRMLLRHNAPQWPIPTRCWVWYVLPSVLIAGAITSSAFWNSFTFA